VYNPKGSTSKNTTFPGRPSEVMKLAIKPPAIKLKKSKSPAKIPVKFCAELITQSMGEPVLFNGAVTFMIKDDVSGIVGVTIID